MQPRTATTPKHFGPLKGGQLQLGWGPGHPQKPGTPGRTENIEHIYGGVFEKKILPAGGSGLSSQGWGWMGIPHGNIFR